MYANRTAGSTALKRLMTEYRGIHLLHVVLFESNLDQYKPYRVDIKRT